MLIPLCRYWLRSQSDAELVVWCVVLGLKPVRGQADGGPISGQVIADPGICPPAGGRFRGVKDAQRGLGSQSSHASNGASLRYRKARGSGTPKPGMVCPLEERN